LFSDGTVAFASQKVALEYGCTLDAVGQLVNAIDRKAIHIEDHSEPCRPVMLVQCATNAHAAAIAEASQENGFRCWGAVLGQKNRGTVVRTAAAADM
jgi:hypothetical protein